MKMNLKFHSQNFKYLKREVDKLSTPFILHINIIIYHLQANNVMLVYYFSNTIILPMNESLNHFLKNS